MNTSPCPDCYKMISVTADTCPNCGRIFKEGERAAQQKAFEAKVAGDSKKSFVIAIVVGVLLLLLFLIGSSSRLTDDQRTRQLKKNEQTGNSMYR